jgi:hypothetical protein
LDAGDFAYIRNADYGLFTIDQLIHMLLALDHTLEVRMDVHPRGHDTGSVDTPMSL